MGAEPLLALARAVNGPPFGPAHALNRLLRAGLLSPAQLVEDGVAIADVGWRNSALLVTPATGRAWLVKRGASGDRRANSTREAAAYQLLANSAGLACVPRLDSFDPAEYVLTVEAFPTARTLREHASRSGRLAVPVARQLGAALAGLHQLTPSPGQLTTLPAEPPWILRAPRPTLALVRLGGAANLRLLQLLQAFPDLGACLDQFSNRWTAAALVHADLKWDNILVIAPPRRREPDCIRLADWEHASWGDPAWDVGTVLSEFLSFWLLSMPLAGNFGTESRAALARYPVERLQPAMRAFWDAYASRRCLSATARAGVLEQSVGYAGARLIQTAFERSRAHARPPGFVPHMLQLSLNVMQRPRDAAALLLGIAEPG